MSGSEKGWHLSVLMAITTRGAYAPLGPPGTPTLSVCSSNASCPDGGGPVLASGQENPQVGLI